MDKKALLAFAYYSLGLEEQRVSNKNRCLECFRRGLELLNECDGAFQVLRAEMRFCLRQLEKRMHEHPDAQFSRTELAFY